MHKNELEGQFETDAAAIIEEMDGARVARIVRRLTPLIEDYRSRTGATFADVAQALAKAGLRSRGNTVSADALRSLVARFRRRDALPEMRPPAPTPMASTPTTKSRARGADESGRQDAGNLGEDPPKDDAERYRRAMQDHRRERQQTPEPDPDIAAIKRGNRIG